MRSENKSSTIAKPPVLSKSKRNALRSTSKVFLVLCLTVLSFFGTETFPAGAKPSFQRAKAIFEAMPTVIKPRSDWDPNNECSPTGKSEVGEVKMAFVHDLPWISNADFGEMQNILRDSEAIDVKGLLNNYTSEQVPNIIKQICISDINERELEDIGVNFLIDDKSGNIYEGRSNGLDPHGTPRSGIDDPIAGAETKGYDKISTNIAVLGDFRIQSPSDATIESLAALLAWKLQLHGVDLKVPIVEPSRLSPEKILSLNPILGHRDVIKTGKCPGDELYKQLATVREFAIKLVATE